MSGRGGVLAACLLVVTAVPLVHAGGSLYREGEFRALTSDPRARRVGDNLTVVIVEASSSATSADTEAQKSGSVGLGIGTTAPARDVQAKIGLNDDFTGKGKIARSGKLAAQITVTVERVLDNGDLMVGGRQVITVNGDKQEIAVKGRVRPQDIAETNSVLSTRLSEASISYLGEGLLAEKQKPGILTRFLSWLGIL